MVLRWYSVRVKGRKKWQSVKAHSKKEATLKFVSAKPKKRR